MTPERWTRIEEIVQAAIDRPVSDRSSFIAATCGPDEELRREVESFLSGAGDRQFTIRSGFEDALKVVERQQAIRNEGRSIGAYRIVREIGRGGMGTVYQAVRGDDAYKKVVAIKIIRRSLDRDDAVGQDVMERFRAERQILAMLDHPNIARLLDAGSTGDGLPYFVMEYIEGEPVDQFCELRNLGIPERLKLFQSVCSAVNYAHQNLVIHRDIKPGNVLVTKDGVPRLLDFGIAKLLQPGADTGEETLLHPRTPDYASPEQMRGDPITTATDIYSLGVLLYVLLAGRNPHLAAADSPARTDRTIGGQDPEKPSAAVHRHGNEKRARLLQGDLDNIVLMALRKDARRRYNSAAQFTEDIDRYLSNRPVLARPDTRGYRIAKFIRRNQAWVAMAAITFLSLAGGIAVSLWQTHVARKQRDLARLEQVKAARINSFLQEMVSYSGSSGGSQNQKGRDATVVDMLDEAARRVETEMEDQPEVKAALLSTIGSTYMTLARIDPATRYLNQAYDLTLKLYGSNSLEIARVLWQLADLHYRKGDYTGADSYFPKAVAIYRVHANDADLDTHMLVGALSDAAFGKMAIGRPDEAEALWRECLSYAPRVPPKYYGQTIAPKTFLAQLYTRRGEIAKADALASEAATQLRTYGRDRFSLAQSLIDLGNIRHLEQHDAEAESLIGEGTKLYAQMQGDDHPNVAYGLLSLATVHSDQRRYDLAEKDAKQGLKIVEKLPQGTSYYVTAKVVLGRIYTRTGRAAQAEILLREALAIRKNAARGVDLASILGALGECLMAQGRYAEAEPVLADSYEMLREAQVPDSPALKEARDRLTSLHASWKK